MYEAKNSTLPGSKKTAEPSMRVNCSLSGYKKIPVFIPMWNSLKLECNPVQTWEMGLNVPINNYKNARRA